MRAQGPPNIERRNEAVPIFTRQITRETKNPIARTMSTRRSKIMPAQRKQLWIGAVEVRPLRGKSEILGDRKGAFVNIVTWATDAEQYRHNAELVIGGLGALFVSDVLNAEPVEDRRARAGSEFDESIEDLISQAHANPNAILYGTFHTFERDDG
jgi:hypothetical protein